MAAGVPIVAQNDWGWREMVIHGETGFLGSDDCELAHHTACLAHDEELRLAMARAAHQHLAKNLADPNVTWDRWRQIFDSLAGSHLLH
jgi:glycosyltransferase involved in cell wall biosynthesis